ncbi:MAG: ATP-binding protein [Candidatus Berkelbacteria bacterium]|nr:ATP-binding protein [Candidatus Berkelbacteria bacterium]
MFLVPYLVVAIFYFCSSYLNDEYQLNAKKTFFLLIITIILSIINITPLTYSSVQILPNGTIMPNTGLGLILNAFFILPLFGLSIVSMIRNIKTSTNVHKRKMIKFALYLILVSFGIQIITSFVIVAIFNYTALVPLGSFLIFLFVILMTASIFYFKAFKINLVGAILFAVILAIFTFAEIFTASNFQELSYKIILFLAVSLIGYQFIRSVQKEIERRRIMEELAEKLKITNADLLTLQHINNKMVSTLDVKKVSQEIVDSLSSELTWKGGFLALINDKKEKIFIEAITQKIGEKITPILKKPIEKYTLPVRGSESLIQRSIHRLEIEFTDSLGALVKGAIGKKTAKEIQSKLKIETFASAPIVYRGRVIGVLIAGFSKPTSKISAEERKMISSIADQAAIAIENAKLYEEIEKANIKLKSLDKLKNEFLSIASHQVRTPLSIIKGYIALLRGKKAGKLSEQQDHFMKNIQEANDQLINIINDFLKLSRIEQKRMKLEISESDIEKIIGEIIERLNHEAELREIKLKFENKTTNLPKINIDEPKIIEVITNLIDNAIKYSPEKSEVKITVERDGDKLNISVADHGIGVPESFKEKLFQKFSRAHNAIQAQPNGNGIGLFLVKKIVVAHRGKIMLKTKEGKGTKFSVILNYNSGLKPGQEIDATELTKKGIIRYEEYEDEKSKIQNPKSQTNSNDENSKSKKI